MLFFSRLNGITLFLGTLALATAGCHPDGWTDPGGTTGTGGTDGTGASSTSSGPGDTTTGGMGGMTGGSGTTGDTGSGCGMGGCGSGGEMGGSGGMGGEMGGSGTTGGMAGGGMTGSGSGGEMGGSTTTLGGTAGSGSGGGLGGSGASGETLPFCGDGIPNGLETCDDGNTQNGDGCSAECTLEPGWNCSSGLPFTCTDINECQAGTAGCDANATCQNTPGAFTCTCNPGYAGDGFSCSGACSPPATMCGPVCAWLDSNADNCGTCGNVCGADRSCVSGTCVGSGSFQISMTWNRPGNADLLVTTPNSNNISWANLGPDAGTDFGQMDRDDSEGTGPENVFWAPDQTPPSGLYHICMETTFFAPPPSPEAPVVVFLTVRRPGEPATTFTKTIGEITSPHGRCNPTLDTYLATVVYP